MTEVSINEFETNQSMYFDMAEKEKVYIRRGDSLFIVSRTPEIYKEPDDDLRNAVSMEVVKERIRKHVHSLFEVR
jgi:hypothetical protein